jgi:SP family sugar:H+ symporter-like MFS transporter
MVPVGITFVFPAIVLCGIPFLPDAPRWLLFHGRRDDAVKTLHKIRPKADVDAGLCEAEVDAIADALRNTPEKGSWLDVFRGTNLRRTLIVIFAMTAQQCTGQVGQSSSR